MYKYVASNERPKLASKRSLSREAGYTQNKTFTDVCFSPKQK